MSVDRVSVRKVVSARQVLVDIGRRGAVPVVRDRLRAIDRYIDYFGGRVRRPTAPWLAAASHPRPIASAP